VAGEASFEGETDGREAGFGEIGGKAGDPDEFFGGEKGVEVAEGVWRGGGNGGEGGDIGPVADRFAVGKCQVGVGGVEGG
jgi:hypothetical protein